MEKLLPTEPFLTRRQISALLAGLSGVGEWRTSCASTRQVQRTPIQDAPPLGFSTFFARFDEESVLRARPAHMWMPGRVDLSACIPSFSRWQVDESSQEESAPNQRSYYNRDHSRKFYSALHALELAGGYEIPDERLLYWFAAYVQPGDLVIADDRDPAGARIARVEKGYQFSKILQQHGRSLTWFEGRVDREDVLIACDMMGCSRTVADLSGKFHESPGMKAVESVTRMSSPNSIPSPWLGLRHTKSIRQELNARVNID
jgi:hypothetical protein